MRSCIPERQDVEFVLRLLMPENRLVMRLCLATGLRIDDALSIKSSALLKDRMTVFEKKNR